MINYKKNSLIAIHVEKEAMKKIKKDKIPTPPSSSFSFLWRSNSVDNSSMNLISNNEKIRLTEKVKKFELFDILRDFLIHFGNFNLDLTI